MEKQEKKVYSAPRCMIIQLSGMSHLMETSFPSQHKKCNVLELVDNFGFLISFFFDKFIC